MLQEHDNQFEDIDFDTPRRHSLQHTDIEYGRLVDNQTDDEDYDEETLSTLRAINKARRSHANELEQRNEMLQYIATKERLIEDLREQLKAHEMELWLLKENWTHIVTQSSSSSSPSPYILKNNEETDKTRHFSQEIANHEKNVVPENIPRTAYDGLISVYQNLRDTLENVAPTESLQSQTKQTLTNLKSAIRNTYEVLSAPIIEEEELDYFSAMPNDSVFGGSPLFVTSPWSQGNTISVVHPRLKKPEPIRSMTR